MKKLLYFCSVLLLLPINAGSTSNWLGHTIKNNTDVTLIVTVKHTSCDSKEAIDCDHHVGHVFIIPPGRSVINTEENASYPEQHGRKENCIIIEAQTPKGQPTISTLRISKPEARNYIITLKDNTFTYN